MVGWMDGGGIEGGQGRAADGLDADADADELSLVWKYWVGRRACFVSSRFVRCSISCLLLCLLCCFGEEEGRKERKRKRRRRGAGAGEKSALAKMNKEQRRGEVSRGEQRQGGRGTFPRPRPR